MAELIYYALDTDNAYRSDQSEVSNTNLPECIYKQQNKDLDIQFLNTESLDENGDFDDFYLGFVGISITSSAACDNNWNHISSAKLNTALTNGISVSEFDIKEVGTDFDPDRPVGTINFADGESVNYNLVTAISGGYTLRTADGDFLTANFTPAADHAVDEVLTCIELPIIKDNAVTVTSKDTGLLNVSFDCFNSIYQSLVEGSSEIDDCIFEIQVFQSGKRILAKQFEISLKGILDDDGETAPAPTGGYFTSAQSDSRYWQQDLSGAYSQVATPVSTDLLPLRQGATSNYISLDQIKTFLSTAGTIVDLPDATETIIVISDVTVFRQTTIDFTIDDSVYYDGYGYKIKHDGSNPPQWFKFGSFANPAITSVAITFDISGNDLRLKINNTTGGALKLVWSLINNLVVSA